MNKKLKLIGLICIILLILVSTSVYYNEKIKSKTEDKMLIINESLNGETVVIADILNLPPYSFKDEDGNIQGFSLEISKKSLEAMGYRVIVKLGEWNEIKELLKSGDVDVITGMVNTPERKEKYSFSSRHSVVIGEVFSYKNNIINDISELEGKTVAVLKNDIMHHYLKKQDINIKFIEKEDMLEAFLFLKEDKCDYVASMKIPGHYIIKENNLKDIQSNNLIINLGNYSMVVKKGNEKLLFNINAGLKVLKTTDVYEKIYEKWFGVYEEKNILYYLKNYYWIIILIIFFILLLVVVILLLRYIVLAKTRELKGLNRELIRKNNEIESSYEEIVAIEDELRSQYKKLSNNKRELEESKFRISAILNAIPDLIFLMDKLGNFLKTEVNRDKDKLIVKDYVGKNVKEVLPDGIWQEQLEKINIVLENNKVEKMSYKLILNGKENYFESRIAKIGKNMVIGIVRDITDSEEYKNEIEFLSNHDSLTGLGNRRNFENQLEVIRKNNMKVAVIIADINGLKLVNDAFGHKAGDKWIIKTANILKKALSKEEEVYRIGGDEFVILLNEKDNEYAEKIVDEITKLCKNTMVDSLELSISFGWESNYDNDKTIDEILIEADDNMYKKKLFDGPSMRGETIDVIIKSLHEKNSREEEHSQRVSFYCEKFAKLLKFSVNEIKEMKMVGLLHDIGKIGISEKILNKAGKLNDDEFEEIKTHPGIGYRILSSVNNLSEMAEYVLAHHEKWDGSGYPKGLKETDIPLKARILAIADSFDAMVSERSYKKSLSKKEAVEELVRSAGSQFDPKLVDIFIKDVLDYDDNYDVIYNEVN